jgi:hypothetical protein
METVARFTAYICMAALIPLGAMSQRTVRPNWPKGKGAYVSVSDYAIPAFPRELSGFRSEDNKDFWNKPFALRGSFRLFEARGWQGIPRFPNTMNGCSAGVFMIRWRTADPTIRVQSSARFSAAVGPEGPKTGAFGYMSGTNCEQPMFNFGDEPARNGSTLVDVYYELKFWQAAP